MHPLALKYLPIRPEVLPLPVLLVIIVHSDVLPTVLPDMHSLPMHLVLQPLPLVASPRMPLILSVARQLILVP